MPMEINDIEFNEIEYKDPVETVLYFANDRKSALEGVSRLQIDIQNNEETAHKLYFSIRPMGAYLISKGEIGEDGKPHVVGNREFLIFPASNEDAFKKLKRLKNIVSMHNVKWICGSGPQKIKRRELLIDWLLGKEVELK